MNKKQLLAALKPLVKECVKEVIFEEGALKKIIKEVVGGLSDRQVIAGSAEPQPPPTVDESRQIAAAERGKLLETKKRMLNAVGSEAYGGVDLFEGTRPLKSGGSPGAPTAPSSPLTGVDPMDSGVDITKMMPGLDKVWKRLI